MSYRVARMLSAGAAGLLAAAAAMAGPDITHQEIQDTVRYPTTGGPVNGAYGYAWGSYTCNLGNQSLSWQSGGTPALAMNAYRLFDGQLLQIGLGNAKHACCVSNVTGCGTCTTGGGGLRPGCRDVYGASFNGGQSRLGPRSGINPYDGTFTPIPNIGGDAVWRRVKVTLADMSATTYPGAQYFAEGVYVCAEENPPEQLNNATYRRMAVANTGVSPTYQWTGQGDSQSGTPAIVAWRDHGNGPGVPDLSVHVVTTDVPNEGRFYVAGKVRDLGNGLWRYDYAAFNLNSHRSASSFAVAVPANASVTDVGFHAPEYHSDDPYDNSDWNGEKEGSLVRFSSPATFETNPNTNALRWGTMYNFWFTTDVPPAEELGSVTLGLFRPGTPSEIEAVGLPVPSTGTPCVADFNGVGGVSVQDIFDFLAAYFNNDAAADINGGGLSVQDIFDFLALYFTGC